MTFWRMRILFFLVLIGLAACQVDIVGQSASSTYSESHALIEKIAWDTVFLGDGTKQYIPGLTSDSASLVAILRHAEKDTIGLDPGLIKKGEKRARRLAELFKETSVDHYYTTHFRRTYLTLVPLIQANPQNISRYEPDDQRLFAGQLLEGKNDLAIVAGHSNTIPELLSFLWQGDPVKLSNKSNDYILIGEIEQGELISLYKFKY